MLCDAGHLSADWKPLAQDSLCTYRGLIKRSYNEDRIVGVKRDNNAANRGLHGSAGLLKKLAGENENRKGTEAPLRVANHVFSESAGGLMPAFLRVTRGRFPSVAAESRMRDFRNINPCMAHAIYQSQHGSCGLGSRRALLAYPTEMCMT